MAMLTFKIRLTKVGLRYCLKGLSLRSLYDSTITDTDGNYSIQLEHDIYDVNYSKNEYYSILLNNSR